MNNKRKEFPESGLEQDCISKWGRKYYSYVNNIRGIKRYAKNQMNRRFRRFNKMLYRKEED